VVITKQLEALSHAQTNLPKSPDSELPAQRCWRGLLALAEIILLSSFEQLVGALAIPAVGPLDDNPNCATTLRKQ
jgi:hypothetical protein